MIGDGVGIVLVIVALGAAHRGSHPDLGEVAHPVGGVDGVVLLELQAALVGGLEQTVVARSHLLFGGGSGQQVPRKLLAGEPVEGQVVVEGSDHPVPVWGNVVRLIPMIAHGVGEADQIQPIGGHPFPVMRGVKQLIDQGGVGLRRGVLGVGPDRFRGRGKSGQVKVQATDQGDRVGVGSGA